MPRTKLGKGSVGLILAMFVLFLIGPTFTSSLYKSIPAGDTILADIANRPALAIAMLIGMVSGISAFIIGLTAIIKQKERTILVYLATIVGAGLIVFLIGEFSSPH